MLLSLLLALAAAAPAAPTSSPPPAPAAYPPSGQDEPEIPDKRPEVAELIATLGAHVKERGEQDQQAIGVIDKLILEFEKSGPKDRAAIADAASNCLEAKRKDLSEGVPDTGLFVAAATAMGRMSPESVKLLAKWIGNKKQKEVVVQRALILSLGRTKDVEGLKPLLGCLDNHQAAIVAAGAEALGDFEGASQETRKEVFGELLKVLMSAKGNMDNDVNDTIARERYDVIAAPLITSLKRLSGHDENQPEAWQSWWNNNKKEDWEKVGKEEGGN